MQATPNRIACKPKDYYLYFAKNHSLERLFSVGSERYKKEGLLLCEWGEQFCCVAWYNKSEKVLHNLEYYTFSDTRDETLQPVYKAIQNSKVEEAVICSAFPESILMPPRLFDINQPLLQYLYPDNKGRLLNDMIAEWQVINQYSIPQDLFQQIFSGAPTTNYFHTYTCSLKACNGSDNNNLVKVQFDPNHFRVLVMKQGKPILAQTYSYNAPLDVVYYLLKIYEHFQVKQEEAELVVSGLIEEDSALYRELYNYFLHLQIEKTGDIKLDNNSYPEHFFTSMYNLAACVS